MLRGADPAGQEKIDVSRIYARDINRHERSLAPIGALTRSHALVGSQRGSPGY